MSLNTAHAHNCGVLIYAGERILIFYNGIEMSFEGPNTPHFKGKKKGRIYLTTHRMIYTSTDGKDIMQSFSFPFLNLREVELEQPIFGANFIKGRVLAEEGGNWNGEAKFKMHFNHGGAIELGQCMLTAAKLASRNRQAQPPPPYTPPTGPIYQASPPAYEAPHTQYYDWVPYQSFPTAPPPEYVYTMGAPPPYPGVDPTAPHPPPYADSTANAKEKEAAASAYYNPANPHTAYMPPQPSMQNGNYQPPPSYDDATKKQN